MASPNHSDDSDDPLLAKTGLTRAERSARSRIGAHSKWKRRPDRQAATKAMRDAANHTRFENEVDPLRELPPDVRATLAANARQQHMARLALKASKARRLRAQSDALLAEVDSDGETI